MRTKDIAEVLHARKIAAISNMLHARSAADQYPAFVEAFAQAAAHISEAMLVRSQFAAPSNGHFTASIMPIDLARKRVLLGYHVKHDRWQRLGGHCDGESDFANVAKRELEEETGIVLDRQPDAMFGIFIVPVQPRGAEPAHLHYDVNYIVNLDSERHNLTTSDEHTGLKWVAFDAPEVTGPEQEMVTLLQFSPSHAARIDFECVRQPPAPAP